MASKVVYEFYVDTDPPVRIGLDALMQTSWLERFPIEVARIRDLDVDDMITINRIAPFIAVKRVE